MFASLTLRACLACPALKTPIAVQDKKPTAPHSRPNGESGTSSGQLRPNESPAPRIVDLSRVARSNKLGLVTIAKPIATYLSSSSSQTALSLSFFHQHHPPQTAPTTVLINPFLSSSSYLFAGRPIFLNTPPLLLLLLPKLPLSHHAWAYRLVGSAITGGNSSYKHRDHPRRCCSYPHILKCRVHPRLLHCRLQEARHRGLGLRSPQLGAERPL